MGQLNVFFAHNVKRCQRLSERSQWASLTCHRLGDLSYPFISLVILMPWAKTYSVWPFAHSETHTVLVIAKTRCWICWRESVRRRARIFPPLSDLGFDWSACDMWPLPDLAVQLSARDRPLQMFCSPPPSNIQLGCRIFCKFFLDVALLLAVSHRYAPDSASEFLALLHSSEWRTVRGELDQLDLFGKAR